MKKIKDNLVNQIDNFVSTEFVERLEAKIFKRNSSKFAFI